MNEIRSLRSLLVWIVPFAIVLAILGWETDWGGGVSLPVPVAAPAAPQPVNVALIPEYRIDGGLAARNETVDRVLFNPTRRPAPPAAQAAAGSSAIQHGKYVLTGTAVAGGVATAMLREAASGKSHTVRKGEKLDGALVAEVTPDSIKLRQGDDTEELHLKVALGPKMTVQAALPGAAPLAAGQVPGLPAAAAAAAGNNGARRGVPQAGFRQPATAARAAGQRPGTVSVGELLAERRRAAAAQAAAGGTAAAPTDYRSRAFRPPPR